MITIELRDIEDVGKIADVDAPGVPSVGATVVAPDGREYVVLRELWRYDRGAECLTPTLYVRRVN